MQVILLEQIRRLGVVGDLVNVKNGFARNYLLPLKKALRATEENKEVFAKKRAEIEKTNLEKKQDAEKLSSSLKGKSVVLIRQAAEDGRLYGSVTASDIAKSIKETFGVDVIRAQVELNAPIKNIGIYNILVALHPEVRVEVAVNVARSELEAESGKQIEVQDIFEKQEDAEKLIAEEETTSDESENKEEA